MHTRIAYTRCVIALHRTATRIQERRNVYVTEEGPASGPVRNLSFSLTLHTHNICNCLSTGEAPITREGAPLVVSVFIKLSLSVFVLFPLHLCWCVKVLVCSSSPADVVCDLFAKGEIYVRLFSYRPLWRYRPSSTYEYVDFLCTTGTMYGSENSPDS